jgi:bacteriocin biosynthesis cyclodehydratase domain-containing protein
VDDHANGHVPLWSPTPTTAKGTRRRPDLVVLADTHRRELPATLVRRVVPHLAVSASEAIGVVGPLVLPGRSACLRCLDLARAERDPAWPLILAQLAGQAAADPRGCDTVLATTVAAQAATQALAFVDQGAEAAAAVTNGTLELVLPGWQWRRRSWHPHPQCGCRHRDQL